MEPELRPAEWEVAVLIPARDEELLLARCLESTLIALDRLPRAIRAAVVLVSDCSTDRTLQIATELLGKRGTVLSIEAGTVGIARARGAAHIVQTAVSPLHRLWLANTDADCVIPPAWLVDQLDLAEQGVEAVAGVVSVDSFAEHDPEVPGRFEASYRIEADGGHPHVHGANMGVRADCYLRAGGWAGLKTAEDHDLWRRLRATGARTRSTARIRVATSGRRVGRAPNGFAGALAAHNGPRAAA